MGDPQALAGLTQRIGHDLFLHRPVVLLDLAPALGSGLGHHEALDDLDQPRGVNEQLDIAQPRLLGGCANSRRGVPAAVDADDHPSPWHRRGRLTDDQHRTRGVCGDVERHGAVKELGRCDLPTGADDDETSRRGQLPQHVLGAANVSGGPDRDAWIGSGRDGPRALEQAAGGALGLDRRPGEHVKHWQGRLIDVHHKQRPAPQGRLARGQLHRRLVARGAVNPHDDTVEATVWPGLVHTPHPCSTAERARRRDKVQA